MRNYVNAPIAILTVFLACSCSRQAPTAPAEPSAPRSAQPPKWGMVIHTGAGNFTLSGIAERKDAMQAAMNDALTAGYRVLADGGTSLDAVQAAIVILEDSPLFNAGKGAVFTHDGTNELDASIMDGGTMRAGAVAGLKHIKNPIRLARLVMEKSPHVMMAGDGAEAFAKQQGVKFVDQKYFYTDRAWKALQDDLAAEKKKAAQTEDHHGTVGAVALDQHGNLAAGTSTGGLTNKRFGRIGDSPVIGAGTYANNQSCAISSTGIGEYWIRYTVAHDICARVQYLSTPIQVAADEVVQKVLKPIGGEGGVIGLDAHGNLMMSFNTNGMGRGYVGSDGKPTIMFTAETMASRAGAGPAQDAGGTGPADAGSGPGRIAIVTGAGSGIGKAVALALVDDGYSVVFAGRRADLLDAAVTCAGEAASRCVAVPTDVKDPESVRALFATTRQRFGRLDLLFNNAGIGTPPIPMEDLSFEQWKSVVDTNLNGAFLCTQEAIRIMKVQTPRGGRIINNGSISAHTPRPHSVAYTATKHAITGLTRSTSLDGRAHDIACGQIDIGNAATELTARMPLGVLQANGQVAAEPTIDTAHVGRAVVYMANLPLDANVQFMTLMATKMPWIGRG